MLVTQRTRRKVGAYGDGDFMNLKMYILLRTTSTQKFRPICNKAFAMSQAPTLETIRWWIARDVESRTEEYNLIFPKKG